MKKFSLLLRCLVVTGGLIVPRVANCLVMINNTEQQAFCTVKFVAGCQEREWSYLVQPGQFVCVTLEDARRELFDRYATPLITKVTWQEPLKRKTTTAVPKESLEWMAECILTR